MTSPDPRTLVREGYDRIGDAYGRWRRLDEGPVQSRFVPELLAALPVDARVLDIGCGDGVRSAPLIERFHCVGLDLSWVQLALASKGFRRVRLVQADAARLPFRDCSFDAVVAWYSLIHVPREEHGVVFREIANVLRPGGRTILSVGMNDEASGIESNWLGVPMFWSGFDVDTSVRLIEASSLEIEAAEAVDEQENGQTAAFLWVVARRSMSRPRPR
jgi:SAM-dependent methyltransferase